MTIYYIILSYLSIWSLFDHTRVDRRQKISIYVITIIFLIFFAGLRGSDPDWYEYAYIFKSIIVNNGLSFADFGFNFLCKFISYISHNPIALFFVVATVSISLNAITITRLTPFIFSALLLYFCHNYCLKEMIQIRVGLASAICLFSFYYLKKKQQKLFICLFIIAVTIHLTSAIFILAYIGQRILNKQKILYCVLLSLLIGIFCPFGRLLKTAVGIDPRLDDYIAYGDEGYAQSLGIWTNMNSLKCLTIFCFLYYYYDKLASENRYFEMLFKSYILGLSWLLCFNDFAIIGARMSNILLSTEPILLTYPYFLFKPNSRFIYSFVIISLAWVIFNTNIAPNKITPYVFYFSK